MAAALLSLPTAVLQLLMHSLHAKEIIALARCSKCTLQCADSEFAWRHCPPTQVHVSSATVLPRLLDGCSLSDPTTRVRFRQLSVEWSAQSAMIAKGVVRDLIRVAQSFNIVCLHVSTFGHYGLIPDLLKAPELQQSLHTFSVRDPTSRIIALAADLPLLHTLGIRNRVSCVDCAALEYYPALTSLALWFPLDLTSEFAATLGALPLLRELSLRKPSVSEEFSDADYWPSFCAALPRIESLDIHDWVKLGRIPQETLTAGFSAMHSLRRLKLDLCGDIDPCLIALHEVPSLRTLVLDLRGLTGSVLASLMNANPQLHTQFLFPPGGSLAELVRALPQRISVDP